MSLIQEFVNPLAQITPPHRRRKINAAIENHFANPRTRDDSGFKDSEVRQVLTTLRHVHCMQRWIDDESYDLNIRRTIKDKLKHIDHGLVWTDIVEECRTARGLINKAERKSIEEIEYGPSEVKQLGEGYSCHPLNTIAKLRSAGKRGRNCLSSNSLGYWDSVQRGEASYFEVRQLDSPTAYIQIACKSHQIKSILGPGNTDVELPESVLWRLCEELDAWGDDLEQFHDKGILRIFVQGNIDRNAPMLEFNDFALWSKPGWLVIHDIRENHWSQFKYFFYGGRGGWTSIWCSHSGGEFLRLMRRLNRKVDSFVRNARPAPVLKDALA